MRESSEDPKLNSKELNKILPSYLLNEVKEDNKDLYYNEKEKRHYYFNNKVSKIICILHFII